jgi:hypothetical protein
MPAAAGRAGKQALRPRYPYARPGPGLLASDARAQPRSAPRITSLSLASATCSGIIRWAMSIYDYAGNTHVHTTYSDGTGLHADVAEAAARAGLDFLVFTDHNVWVQGLSGYYGDVLVLIGEEIHDPRLAPQANHLLAYNAQAELAQLAAEPQELIDGVREHGGFAFLAHPFEYRGRISPSLSSIPWRSWEVEGYAGLEIWNYMSEFKARLHFRLLALFYALFPSWAIRGPFRVTLAKWDQLLAEGRRVSAIGGADAHAETYSMGPLRRVVFPYEHQFRCVNTHIVTEERLNGEADHDREIVYRALQAGRTWVGYDLPAPTAGFRFSARSGSNRAIVGEELVRTGAAIFEIAAPAEAQIRLVHDGRVVARASGRNLKHTSAAPGAYRVEAYRRFRLRRRGWIFSSPIYVV